MDTKKELKPLLSWFPSDFEEEDIEFEWEYLLEQLDELIKEVNSEGYWLCKVRNFGWRKISGHAFLQFETGNELVQKVLPETECSFNVFRENNIIKIQNFHHDSPTGNEHYILTPISQEQFENEEI